MNTREKATTLLLATAAIIVAPTHLAAAEPDSAAITRAAADTARLSKMQTTIDNIGDSHLFHATYLGVPLVVGGLIEKRYDSKFRRLRNDFMPEFHRPFDNYMQLAPVAVMLGLKAAGVESRSSWKRMAVSDAISAVMMAGVAQGLKHTTNVTRPDGSDNHSFPSGHTATAFMAATMLSKEYGHISPWISAGAYATATATGLMRVANNKHWLSDVMVGAGIGILSTEFGYWIADAIMKDRGLNVRDSWHEGLMDYDAPSFFGLYMGFNVPLSKFDITEEIAYQTSTGTTLGVEGAWFFSRYLGIGGRATVSNLQFIVNDTEAPDNTFDFYGLGCGPYFSLPITPRLTLGSKALLTHTHYTRTDIGGARMRAKSGLGFGTGINADYRVRRHFGFGIFADYDTRPPYSRTSSEYLHMLTLGARAAIRF